MADGTLIFDTNLDTSGLSTGLGKIGSMASTAFKGIAVAVGTATTAIGALAKSALDGYAEYEQLIGGVETLYGMQVATLEEYAQLHGKTTEEMAFQFEKMQGREQAVLDNASNAYKTAGMSANEYMATVNGFAASLTSSLGEYEWQAANYADMIVTDMSDNANKMGTSMEALQNAYSGFAKQNYTMLDNLKLGYGGTKEEMERLLRDAEKMEGYIEGSFDISNFADVAEAIHIVQENMGITGTTAKEASATIEGSVSAMKASWENLVVGIADDNADLDALINQFIESATTAMGNIIPRIEIILTGIGQLIEQMVPVIIAQLPGLIESVLPQLLSSGISMVNSIIQGITTNLPALIEMALGLMTQLVTVLIENLPLLIETGLQIVVQLALGIAEALPELIPTLVDTVLLIVETLIDNIDMLIDASIAIIMALAEGLIDALPKLVEKIPIIITKLIDAIVRNLPKLVEMGITLIVQLAGGLIKAIPQLVAKIPQIITALVSGFIKTMSKFNDIGKNIVEGLWQGISNGFTWIKNKITGWVGDVMDFFKKLLGINSPSKEFRLIGEMCVAGFDEGIEPLLDGSDISRSINASVKTLRVNTAYGSNRPVGGISQTININREISTPDEMARAIRLESRYGLMKGVGFA